MTTLGAALPGTRGRALGGSASVLVVGKVLQMGFGFLFWVVAARTTSLTVVGVVAATVPAVMLVTQVAMLGVSSALIVAIGRGEAPGEVLDTGLTVVAATSLVTGAGFLAVVTFGEGVVAVTQTSFPFWVWFLLAVVAGTAFACFDQAGIALGRAGGTMTRYALGGLVTTGVLVGTAVLVDGDLSATAVFGAWALGSVVVCVVALVQLHRWIGYLYSGRVHLPHLRSHLRVGLPNHLLTLTERMPALLVPLLVAHLVSPEATARWYPAWMLAWIAFTVPVQMGLVQFAEGVRRPDDLRHTVRSGLWWGLATGSSVALAVAVLAHPLLTLVGTDYAESSATALRVLAVGVVPYTLWQTYNARCRATGAVREGVLAGLVLAVLICCAAVVAAPAGPTALAVAWLGSSTCGAVWAAFRLRRHLEAT